MKVLAYVVGASKNPDAVECMVPYKVNSDTIFFGPCKKLMREKLYEQYLKDSKNGKADVLDDIYVLGVNASNPKKIRKIIWVGRVLKVLTFERAYNILSSKKEFKKMMEEEYSPLNLEPLYDRGTFIGYKLRSKEHEKKNEWVLDVIKKKNNPDTILKEKTLLLEDPYKRNEVFIRDCVFLCENIFFAEGKGIDIDEGILSIFKKAQRGKKGIDNYAIFGLRSDSSADGLTGRYLEIDDGEIARALIEKISKIHENFSMQNISTHSNDIQRRGKCR